MRISQAIAPLSFDESLFLIGCTICQHGLSNEGMSVIVAYALGNGDAQYHEDAQLAMKKTRAEYLATLRQKNLLWEIINDKWDSYTIGMYNQPLERCYSLRELASGAFATAEELYSACILNYMNVAGRDLMLLFFNTKVAYEYMSKRIRKSSNHALSEDTIQTAYRDFMNYYTIRSLRSYKAETGNPLGALAFTFNEYYLKSSNDPAKVEANFYSIINAVGVMTENDDGLRPHLDSVRVAPAAVGKGLDFMDAVEKIYKASELLYRINARKGSFLYYDLFSRYRDMVMHEPIKDLRAQFRSVCDFWEFTLQDSIEYRESKDSISQYSADRKAVTERLLDLVQQDIPEQQMFDFYKNLYNTDLNVGRNGSKGFANMTFSKSSKFRQGLSFDQQIQIAIEGALALKKLLLYARSHNIDINRIDYRIFRDARLQHKCKTLEDYIALQSDLQNLVEAAEEEECDNLMQNDEVAAYLQNLETVKTAVVAKDTTKAKRDYRACLSFFKKLSYVKFMENVDASSSLSRLNSSILALRKNEITDGYSEICNLVTYVNCNFKIAALGGCNFYDADKDRMSDVRIIEFAGEVLKCLDVYGDLAEANLQMFEILKERFGTDSERIILTTASLAETFLLRLMQYVDESEEFYADYIMSLLDKKYELWMNIDIDSFDSLYNELIDCSRQYNCNYTLDKEIVFKEELKGVFVGLMERGNLISKSPVYTQRKLVAIPSKQLIEANQAIMMIPDSGLSKLVRNQLRNMFSFNSVGFAYQNGVLLKYKQCYVHRNGYLYCEARKSELKEITLDDLVHLTRMRGR